MNFIHKFRHLVWGRGGFKKMTLDDREGGEGLRRPKKGWRNLWAAPYCPGYFIRIFHDAYQRSELKSMYITSWILMESSSINIWIMNFIHKFRHPVWGWGGFKKMTLDDREGGEGLRRPKKVWRNLWTAPYCPGYFIRIFHAAYQCSEMKSWILMESSSILAALCWKTQIAIFQFMCLQ